MSQIPPNEMEQHLPGYEPPAGELGVMDALRMGWRLVMSDFWPIWLVGLVAYAVNFGAGLPGAIPYLGACIQLAVCVFVLPPLAAGLFYAVAGVIDGRKANAGEVFEGFRQRYWPSVVALLLPWGIYLGACIVIGGLIGVLVAVADEANEDVIVLLALLIAVPAMIILMLVMLLFLFALVAVWDHPESGWEAMKTSVRIVKERYLSTLGFAVLAWLIGLLATVVGVIACCVGVFFTVPFSMVWIGASMIYLYRSWTGRPLVQPAAEEPFEPTSPLSRGSPFPPRDAMGPPPPDLTGGPAGPLSPTDIEPPA